MATCPKSDPDKTCEVCGEPKEVEVYARTNGRKLEVVGTACLACGAFRQNGRGV